MQKKSYLLLFILMISLFSIYFVYLYSKGNVKDELNTKSDEVENAPKIKIATFNIAGGRVTNITDLASAIKTIDADIIALQEVDKLTKRSGYIDQSERLAKLTGMNAVFGRAIDHDDGEYGLAFLSKYPIYDTKIIPLPSGKREQRIILIAKIDLPNFPEPITVFNTHLDNQLLPILRLEQVEELNNRAKALDGIKILFGDMNDIPLSFTWNKLSDNWNESTIDSVARRSWPAKMPIIQIDYIFTGKAQKWQIDSLIVPNKTGEWNNIYWPNVSDHLPAIVEMRLIEQ